MHAGKHHFSLFDGFYTWFLDVAQHQLVLCSKCFKYTVSVVSQGLLFQSSQITVNVLLSLNCVFMYYAYKLLNYGYHFINIANSMQ